MKLSNYLNRVVSKLNDSRIVENTTKLIKNIIEYKSIKLWRISENKLEYDRSKRLLDGSLKSVLDAETTSAALREHSVAALGKETRLIMLHDPCDLRKEYAQDMENLGQVRNLKGNIVNGYSTINTVASDVTGKNLYPTDTITYSNKDEHYVTVEEMTQFKSGKMQEEEIERGRCIKQFVEEDSYINLPKLVEKQLKTVSDAFKKANPSITLLLDRQFDGQSYFEFIDRELNDDFVIRVKISRNSNEVKVASETHKAEAVKLKHVVFAQRQCDIINKLTLKKRVYESAKCLLEWGKLTLNDIDYNVVRVTLQDREGKPIYNNPMLLITNIKIKSGAQARDIYKTYLMRAKIESVFKFLKDVLGWEEFQVRDYESIKNLTVLTFFIGGYFYEIGSKLTDNPTIALIALLGGGKEKVTRHYFVEGLKKLLIYKTVERFLLEKEEEGEGETLLAQMLEFVT